MHCLCVPILHFLGHGQWYNPYHNDLNSRRKIYHSRCSLLRLFEQLRSDKLNSSQGTSSRRAARFLSTFRLLPFEAHAGYRLYAMDHAYAHGDLSSLFLSDKYADLDIICNGLRFPAHRAVICPKSATLRKFCDIWVRNGQHCPRFINGKSSPDSRRRHIQAE